ncbi:MAG: hypothetical protein CMG49_05850 [Candidatus Marinimicrobia bacterium]|nr:hypothetical protein [Candidatus Neomarinimicrobiota bacterium]
MEPYVIPIFTDEWWRNNIVTFLIIGFLLFIGNKLSEKNNYFNFIIGSFLILRLPWNQYYQYQIGQYNLEWSLPLQMCSFSSFFSGLILVLHGLNIDKKYKNLLFEFLLYWSVGAFYSFITPQYTTGIEGLIYYDYYVSHGGILFSILFCRLFLGYFPRKGSWKKIFIYSQFILLIIHAINYIIGGQANYFYTMIPPAVDNPLVVGAYPTHIILMNIFAGIHFYFIYLLTRKK